MYKSIVSFQQLRQVETSWCSTIYGKSFFFFLLIYNSTTGQICVQCILYILYCLFYYTMYWRQVKKEEKKNIAPELNRNKSLGNMHLVFGEGIFSLEWKFLQGDKFYLTLYQYFGIKKNSSYRRKNFWADFDLKNSHKLWWTSSRW